MLFLKIKIGRKLTDHIYEITDSPLPAIALQKKNIDVQNLALFVFVFPFLKNGFSLIIFFSSYLHLTD